MVKKYIPYDEVLEFLNWQFDEEFADMQINEFSHIEIEDDDNQRNDD